MTEIEIAGPMSMIKIDGAKIKYFREKQGLTQLYLATAVQVTTDTISRWENRRYPSIKQENGIKLAEALNVHIKEILEVPSQEDLNKETNSVTNHTAPPEMKSRYGLKKTWPLILLGTSLMAVIIAFLKYTAFTPVLPQFSAERIIPPHCTPGQPFPVIIKVTGSANASTSFIIRENLPPNSTLNEISPSTNSSGRKDGTIKWLKKINTTAVFAYVISIEGRENDEVHFNGTSASGRGTESPPLIGGDNSTIFSIYHWADTDRNNIISDSEILAVYDRYSEINAIDLYIDAIEEIWLGSSYRWNAQSSSFEILD